MLRVLLILMSHIQRLLHPSIEMLAYGVSLCRWYHEIFTTNLQQLPKNPNF